MYRADSGHVRQRIERSRGIPGGNTRRRFHGTIRRCRLGDTSSEKALCTLRNCNLCRIIKVPPERTASFSCHSCAIFLQSSFQVARAGQRTNFGRFGAGIYTSATSSKVSLHSIMGTRLGWSDAMITGRYLQANDYSAESASPNKAMLLNDVVMGRVIKLTRTNTSLRKVRCCRFCEELFLPYI